MMRPVILSRPAKTAVGLVMGCGGGSMITASLGCGDVFAGCGALRGDPGPGGKAVGVCPGAAAVPCGAGPDGGWGANIPPGGGGRGGGWMFPWPGGVRGGGCE